VSDKVLHDEQKTTFTLFLNNRTSSQYFQRATEEFAPVFVAADWGYLILLYVMLTLIRYFLLGTFYPRESNLCYSVAAEIKLRWY